ncbi:TOP3B [Symbiodinium necroappetens]|uniref:DNA topoisomerase n=1 Tax=Symbiodinium necroappetens TaxID=1628268 RepID=A0A813BZE4_9DINO|nr:TOP3B [Symbiodinium necroappetens]
MQAPAPPESGGAFMDDTYLWSHDRTHLQATLAALERHLARHGLLINPRKTAVIYSQPQGGGAYRIGGEMVGCRPFGEVVTALGSPLTFGESVAAIITPGAQSVQQTRSSALRHHATQGVLRWSTFQLGHTWDLYGHMARAQPGGRPMLSWKDLEWWELEKQKPRAQRHTHVKYNALADPERQVVAVAGTAWKQLAADFQTWGRLGEQFVSKFDDPWAHTYRRSQQQQPTLHLSAQPQEGTHQAAQAATEPATQTEYPNMGGQPASQPQTLQPGRATGQAEATNEPQPAAAGEAPASAAQPHAAQPHTPRGPDPVGPQAPVPRHRPRMQPPDSQRYPPPADPHAQGLPQAQQTAQQPSQAAAASCQTQVGAHGTAIMSQRVATTNQQADPATMPQPQHQQPGATTYTGQPTPTATGGTPHQHARGMQPGGNPKEAWGYYAPTYDPATDPWHEDDEEDASQPMLPQPGQATRMGTTQQQPLVYTVPAAPNQWGYTLTYHPPLQQATVGSNQPCTQQPQHQGQLHSPEHSGPHATAQHRQPEAVNSNLPGQGDLHAAMPAQGGTTTQPQQQQQPAPQEVTLTCPQLAHQPPNCNRWGRTLQPLTQGNGPTTGTTVPHPGQQPQYKPTPQGYEPPPWAVPADYIPPWERDPHRPQDTKPAPSSSSGEAFTQQPQQQPEGTMPTMPPTAEGHCQQTQHPAGHPDPTTTDGGGMARGGSTTQGEARIAPTAELEEEDPTGGTGGGKAQRPYHEGHGDQRMRGKRFKAAVQTAFGQRGWTKGDDVTWKEVAHLVGLREEDDESEWARVLAEGAQRGGRRRRGPAAAATATVEQPDDDNDATLQWDGLFNSMLISPGGADRPDTFPPELPFHADAEMHLRGLPHGAWAGITLPWQSRRGPEYASSTRGYCRIKVRRRPGGIEPAGYMATSTSFVLFPWGAIQGGRPRKWLLHITGGPPQEDPEAAATLGVAIFLRLGEYDPRASNNPPMAWEQMALQLIPPPGRRREPAQNPTFPGDNQSSTAGPSSPPVTAPSPSPTQRGNENGQPDEEDDEIDEPSFMQRATQLNDTAASSAGETPQDGWGQRRGRPAGGRPHRMAPAAAMVRRWLRQLAAILQAHPMGDAIPLLLEETMEMVGTCTDDDRWQDDGTVGGPGPCKKRRILNMIYVARSRLELICEDDGIDGYNQHQIWEDLKTALGDLRRGQEQFQQATQGQGGYQAMQGSHGLDQAIAAVQAAAGATMEGDLDWLSESWSQVITVLVQDAEDLLEEEGILDYVHPADVVALEEGGQEAQPPPAGGPDEQIDRLLRNARAVMNFVPAGGEQMRQLLAAILIWRQQTRGESIAVDTQTTDAAGEGSQPAEGLRPTDAWVPPVDTEQWTGSIPSSSVQPASPEGDLFEPTDADLVQAPVVKTLTDSARKARVAEHLQELAEASSQLCLWLDADREGENIGFEVIAVCRDRFPDNSNVHRAIFSALTREEDNPVARAAVAEALVDQRSLLSVFVFDPRFLDRSNYGRVTDPEFKKSISTRKPVDFGNRKTSALRARFWLQCVRAVGQDIVKRGGNFVATGFVTADQKTSWGRCRKEPVSPEQTDVEDAVALNLKSRGSELRREWGAMSLYHCQDLPFGLNASPGNYTELTLTLGWEDLWRSPARSATATPIRFPVAVLSDDLPGTIGPSVLENEREALKLLGYDDQEIEEAVAQQMPPGGETSARELLERWLREDLEIPKVQEELPVFWDLPTGGQDKASGGKDPLQWANLARPDGWLRVSHYMAVGCISAREILARADDSPNFNGVAHRLLWRELHRLNAIRWGRRLFWLQGPGRVERPWSWDTSLVDAWKAGRTGVPYIDACMRELKQTGWLAYKGRKTAGFYFVFILGLDWRWGAFHFEDVLLDYDVAMNYGNWVVVAEVDKQNRGAHGFTSLEDLAAWKRDEFEWKLTAEKANDASGSYIKRWLPELANVDASFVHHPWTMTQEQMAKCGCVLGKDYPQPRGGPFQLKEQEDMNVTIDTSDALERRSHPNDPNGYPYTFKEFIDFALARGSPASFGKQCWEESLPVSKAQPSPEMEVAASFNQLGRPDMAVAQGVDTRQELDLRVGISFSRLLTRQLTNTPLGNVKRGASRSITYGPCQTPALGFCAQRQREIESFQPQKRWTPEVELRHAGSSLTFVWKHGQLDDEKQAVALEQALLSRPVAKLRSSSSTPEVLHRPTGLNTVQLLRSASNALGLGPKQAMKVAEDLYSAGIISYPRTETTRYHETFDAEASLRPLSRHPTFGRAANRALGAWRSLAGKAQSYRARDVGDHPPIVPLRVAGPDELRSAARRLYDFVCRHFLASWLGDVKLERRLGRCTLLALALCLGAHVGAVNFAAPDGRHAQTPRARAEVSHGLSARPRSLAMKASKLDALGFKKQQINDAARNVAFIAVIAGTIASSWIFTGKWWKVPLGLALPSMLYRLWTTRGNTEKLAQVSASVDSKYIASTEEAQQELHMFMCSSCGYTLFPARGREGAFFNDKFKCPMCGASKEEFVDMNDDDDDGSAALAAAAARAEKGEAPAA